MRRGNMYISSIVKRPNRLCLLVGGVLLSCLFALVPNSSYAISVDFDSDTSQSVSKFSSFLTTNCFFANYDLGSAFRPTLGFSPNIDGSNYQDMCHYRYGNNGLGYDDRGGGYTYNSITAGAETFTNAIPAGSQFSYAFNINPNVPSEILSSAHSIVNRFGVIPADNHPEDQYQYFDFPSGSADVSDSYSLVAVKFKLNYNQWVHTPIHVFHLETPQNKISFHSTLYTEGSLDTNQLYSDLVSSVDSSSLFLCPSDQPPTNAFPSGYIDWEDSSDYCYIFFDIPFSNEYQTSVFVSDYTSGFQLRFPTDDQFDWKFPDGSLVSPSRRYYQALLKSIPMSSDNYNPHSQIYSDAQIVILSPETAEEAEIFSTFHKIHQYAHEDAVAQAEFTQVVPSEQQTWFDVFKFNFSFPMLSFFYAFTDADCVNIPILAGMLDTSTTQYCSPWKDTNVRSILTPVFSILSAMILSGFIMHWLGSKSSSVDVFDHSTKTKGGA